jgi:MYXO-CTERM domain-containing protein
LSFVPQAAAQGNQPNIILFLVDDMGYGDAGANGQTKFTTPNIDRMAAEGMRFTDFYAAAPVCAPSRTSLLQGLHTGHGRVRDNDATRLTNTDVALPTVLKEAGYNTGIIGKWGIGESSPDDSPKTHGVDYFYGYINNYHAHNFYPEFIVKNGEKVPLGNVCAQQCGSGLKEGSGVAGAMHPDYVPFLLRDEAMAYIERSAKLPAPFFLMYSLNIPHTNNEGGYDGHGQEVPDYGEFAAQNWPKAEQGYAQMMRYIDNDVGQMLTLLRTLGIDEHTLVLFTSDNGPHAEGGHDPNFFDSNGPFSGIKRDVTEGGIRVPMIARWPGVVAPGSVSDHAGYSPDFMPTFAALAGITPPTPTDGLSIVPTLLGKPEQQEQHNHLYWHLQGKEAVREGDWKLVGGALYNLAADPGEKTNVAAANPEVLQRLTGLMGAANTAPVNVTWTKEKVPPVGPPPNGGSGGVGGGNGGGGNGGGGTGGGTPPEPPSGGAGGVPGEPPPNPKPTTGPGPIDPPVGGDSSGGTPAAAQAGAESSGCSVRSTEGTPGWTGLLVFAAAAMLGGSRYGRRAPRR